MMELRELWAVFGAIACNVAAQVALKQSAQATLLLFPVRYFPGWLAGMANPWIWTGLAAYGVSFGLTVIAYRAYPLSIVSPFMAAVIIVLTTLAGTLFFAEPLGWQRMAGIGLIIAGIVLLTR